MTSQVTGSMENKGMFFKPKAGMIHVDRGDPAGFDFTSIDFVIDGAWHTLDVSAIVPPDAVMIEIYFSVRGDSDDRFILRKNGHLNSYNIEVIRCQVDGQAIDNKLTCDSSSDGLINYWAAASITAINAIIRGWWV